MVVTFSELRQYRGLVSLVDGAFDPLHWGHLHYFRGATTLGYPLFCNVATDAYVRTKHRPLLPEWQRVLILDALRDVTYTHLNTHDTAAVLEELRPAVYVKGKDWEGRLPETQIQACERFGIRLVFLETVVESSTRLLQASQSTMARSVSRSATDHRDS